MLESTKELLHMEFLLVSIVDRTYPRLKIARCRARRKTSPVPMDATRVRLSQLEMCNPLEGRAVWMNIKVAICPCILPLWLKSPASIARCVVIHLETQSLALPCCVQNIDRSHNPRLPVAPGAFHQRFMFLPHMMHSRLSLWPCSKDGRFPTFSQGEATAEKAGTV